MRYPEYTVQILRDTPQGEIEIDVEVEIEPGEKSFWDAVEGVGSPGFGPDAHVLEGRYQGKVLVLSPEEILDAEELALDVYAEENNER